MGIVPGGKRAVTHFKVLERFKDRIAIVDASKNKEEVINESYKLIMDLIND